MSELFIDPNDIIEIPELYDYINWDNLEYIDESGKPIIFTEGFDYIHGLPKVAEDNSSIHVVGSKVNVSIHLPECKLLQALNTLKNLNPELSVYCNARSYRLRNTEYLLDGNHILIKSDAIPYYHFNYISDRSIYDLIDWKSLKCLTKTKDEFEYYVKEFPEALNRVLVYRGHYDRDGDRIGFSLYVPYRDEILNDIYFNVVTKYESLTLVDNCHKFKSYKLTELYFDRTGDLTKFNVTGKDLIIDVYGKITEIT